MTVSLGTSLRREFVNFFTYGRRSLVSGTQNDIVVSWITLWGMIKVYWLDDLILAYILDHAVCCASAASSGRSLHLIISQLRTKYSSFICPNHVRRTTSSIKKRSKVRRILRTMFGEANVHPFKNGLYTNCHTHSARAKQAPKPLNRFSSSSLYTRKHEDSTNHVCAGKPWSSKDDVLQTTQINNIPSR